MTTNKVSSIPYLWNLLTSQLLNCAHHYRTSPCHYIPTLTIAHLLTLTSPHFPTPLSTYLFNTGIGWIPSHTSGSYVNQLWGVVVDVYQVNGDIVEVGHFWRAQVFCTHNHPVVYWDVRWTENQSTCKTECSQC